MPPVPDPIVRLFIDRRQKLLARLRRAYASYQNRPDTDNINKLSRSMKSLAKFQHEYGHRLPELDDDVAGVAHCARGWAAGTMHWAQVTESLGEAFD
jgi:hypothetical protein